MPHRSQFPIPPAPEGYRACRLGAGDSARLWDLDQRCFPVGIAYSRTEITAILRSPADPFHLAFEAVPPAVLGDRGAGAGPIEAELAGFILAEREGRHGHVITLDVAASHRRRGLGQALMQAAEARYAELGMVGMRLEAAVNNVAALGFYTRSGYHLVRRLPGYYASDLDGLLLEKQWKSGRA